MYFLIRIRSWPSPRKQPMSHNSKVIFMVALPDQMKGVDGMIRIWRTKIDGYEVDVTMEADWSIRVNTDGNTGKVNKRLVSITRLAGDDVVYVHSMAYIHYAFIQEFY